MSVSQDVCTAPKEGCLIRRLSHDVGHHLIRRRKIDLNRVLQVQLTGKMQPSVEMRCSLGCAWILPRTACMDELCQM